MTSAAKECVRIHAEIITSTVRRMQAIYEQELNNGVQSQELTWFNDFLDEISGTLDNLYTIIKKESTV